MRNAKFTITIHSFFGARYPATIKERQTMFIIKLITMAVKPKVITISLKRGTAIILSE
ncbi:MAG: hypothetical protein H0W12_07145 [Chitinophagaceae bacterium]|nr:hypothetical protein [Chitinophagaceae bacterium]